jgi:hypothetical protein
MHEKEGLGTQPYRLGQGASEVVHKGLDEGKRVAEQARERIRREANDAFQTVGRKLHDVEDGLDELANRPDGNPVARRAADMLHRVTDRLDSTSADDLIAGAKRELGRRPGLTIAACFALGFLAGRMLKE